jgi:PH and SEC7 domain-containing protein
MYTFLILAQRLMLEQKTDLSNSKGSNSSGHPSVFTAFPPPVPPLPNQHRPPVSTSPIADVFSSTGKQYIDTSKPLPMISPDHRVMHNDNTPKPSPVFNKGSLPPLTTIKRRSLSVSQVESKPAAAAPVSSPAPPPPPPPQSSENHRLKARDSHDSALGGILDDFRGQLSSLDPVSSGPLELSDPCTPARQVAYRQRQGRTSVSSSSTGHTSHSTQHEPTRPAPARMDTGSSTTSSVASKPFSADVIDVFSSAPTTVVIPPRSSSLIPSRSPLTSGGPPNSRYNSTRLGVSNLRSHSGPPTMLSPQGRDTNRLRVLHRSTASSSEPSLIPDHEPRMCKLFYEATLSFLLSQRSEFCPPHIPSRSLV